MASSLRWRIGLTYPGDSMEIQPYPIGAVVCGTPACSFIHSSKAVVRLLTYFPVGPGEVHDVTCAHPEPKLFEESETVSATSANGSCSSHIALHDWLPRPAHCIRQLCLNIRHIIET